MSADGSVQQGIANGDPERFRESLLACTSALRIDLAKGAVAAPLCADHAARLRGEIEQLPLPGLRRCAESLGHWLASPGGLARRHARDVVGLLEQCIDAALCDAPAELIDPLCARIRAHGDAAAVGDEPETAEGGLLESFADEALDELDRCEELLLSAEIEVPARAQLESVLGDLATVVEVGEAVGVGGLESGRFAADLARAAAAESTAALIDRLFGCVDAVRYAIEVACEAAALAPASIPVSEFLKRLRRSCRDRARDLGGRIYVEIDVDAMARVPLTAAENFYPPLARFAADAVAQAVACASADGEAPWLRIRASADDSQLQIEMEDDAVDEAVAGETIQSLDARVTLPPDLPLHPYRRGYVNVVQVLVD